MDLVELKIEELKKENNKIIASNIKAYAQDKFAELETYLYNNVEPSQFDNISNYTNDILKDIIKYLKRIHDNDLSGVNQYEEF